MRSIFAILPLILLIACQHTTDGMSFNRELREELLAMQVVDQKVRMRAPNSPEDGDIAAVDKRHTARLKEIVHQYGWPTNSLVGKDGANAAFLLAQHADMDLPFQRDVLRMMEPLVASGEAGASNYAYLWDRTHSPQRFGTQGHCVGKSQWEPREMEDPDGVDMRRAEVGLPPMSEYMELVSQFCVRDEG